MGAAKNDFDYLHIINWKRAEELVRGGRAVEMNGIRVVPLEVAATEGVLFFAPEPKSPHGCDISPSGRYVVVGGKLAPVVTIYDVEKIKDAISNQRFADTDRYGVPVLRFDDVKATQIETNLGPLHNEFDSQGRGYVSTFIGNTVDRYTLGPPDYTGDRPFTKIGEIRIHYNVGHICTPESNSKAPKGKYLVALNKWAVDRFNDVGPLLPRNLQLIDITGTEMELLYDMPIGIGEPHYAKMILASKLKPLEVYPVGTDPESFDKSPYATSKKEERVERKQEDGRWVTEVYGTVVVSTITPDYIKVKQGDLVRLYLTNIETTKDATHAFALSEYNVMASIEPGETATIEFIADKPGVYLYYCVEFCSPLHLEMAGWLGVEPT